MNNKYAGFWRRFWATIIDGFLLTIITVAPLFLIYGDEYWSAPVFVMGFWDVMISYVMPLALTVWFWSRLAATPGKMILDIKVVDASTGKNLTVGQSIGRYFAYIPSILALGIGFLWMLFDPKKQTWHDKLAKTIVIHEP